MAVGQVAAEEGADDVVARLKGRMIDHCLPLWSGEGWDAAIVRPGREPLAALAALDDPHAALRRDVARRRIGASLYNERMRPQIVEIAVQFVGAIGGIDHRAGRVRADRNGRCRQFRPVREHDSEPILRPDAHCAQAASDLAGVLIELAVCERCATRCEKRRRERIALGAVAEQTVQAYKWCWAF